MTAPQITPETFPYRRKWTKAQLDEVLERKDRLVAAMTDAVGPTGQVLYLPWDQVHILALHLALAGGDVEDRLAYIVGIPYRPTADDGATPGNGRVAFADLTQWVLKQEYEPAPPDPDETSAKAAAAADQIRRQLTPEVAEALTAILADQFDKHTPSATTRLGKAEATGLEAELRDSAREDGGR